MAYDLTQQNARPVFQIDPTTGLAYGASGAPAGAPVTAAQITTKTVTIANGASLSGAADLGTGRLVGIIMPASWTSAALTFQANADAGATFYDVYDDATERTITASGAAASRFLSLPLSDWLGVRGLKVRSGTSASPVNQGADRVITLVVAN